MNILLTITTCKRIDLFKQTLFSFFEKCLDSYKIQEILIVDDNSSDEDKIEMIQFIKQFNKPTYFVFKNKYSKGHAKSMNIIRNFILNSNYDFIFHLEDDWYFFKENNFLTIAQEILNENENIGQCLINENYKEDINDIIVGGKKIYSTRNNEFILHEHVKTIDEKKEWENKFGCLPNCNYWPHFSLRPSLIKKEIFKNNIFDESKGVHFEMKFAFEYEKYYKSVFFSDVYCTHIGKKTYEHNKNNAYSLNGESQF